MSKTLIVSFLPREGSNTKKIVDAFVQAAEDKTEIIHRDLDEATLPLINKAAMATWWGPEGDNEVETASMDLINELKSANNVIIAAPIYNFGMPAPLKAWVDLVTRAGHTFQYGPNGPEPLLKFDNAAVMMTTGGIPIGSPLELMSLHSKTMLGFLGGVEASVIGAEGLNGSSEDEVTQRVSKAKEQAAELVANWIS